MIKHKPITGPKINQFRRTYNKTIHQTAGESPSYKQSNKDLEVQYIIDSINKQNQIESITPNYKLNFNDKVRLIEPKKTLYKTRYNVSSSYYMILVILGKSIATIVNGSVKTFARFQVIHIDVSTKINESKSR
jgi:alpha-N-acetylglucosamine transferase